MRAIAHYFASQGAIVGLLLALLIRRGRGLPAQHLSSFSVRTYLRAMLTPRLNIDKHRRKLGY